MSLLRARRGLVPNVAALSGRGRVNLFTWYDFSAATGGFNNNGGSVVVNNQTDSDGGSLGNTFTANGANSAHNVARTLTIPPSAQMIYGIRLKRGTIQRLNVREDQQTGNGAVFDLLSGTVVGNLAAGVGSIVADGSYFNCEIAFPAAASSFAGFRVGFLQDTDVDITFEASVTSAATLIMYKAQVWTQ
jgi:hypothetical protein